MNNYFLPSGEYSKSTSPVTPSSPLLKAFPDENAMSRQCKNEKNNKTKQKHKQYKKQMTNKHNTNKNKQTNKQTRKGTKYGVR